MIQVEIISTEVIYLRRDINQWLTDKQNNPEINFKLIDIKITEIGLKVQNSTMTRIMATIIYDENEIRETEKSPSSQPYVQSLYLQNLCKEYNIKL